MLGKGGGSRRHVGSVATAPVEQRRDARRIGAAALAQALALEVLKFEKLLAGALTERDGDRRPPARSGS
jgi:hypothetical protein